MAALTRKQIERQEFNSRNNYQQQMRGIKELKSLPDYQADPKHSAYQQMADRNRAEFEARTSALQMHKQPARLTTNDKLDLINNGSDPAAKHGIVNDIYALPRVNEQGHVHYDLLMDAQKTNGKYFDRREPFSQIDQPKKGDEYLGHTIDKGDLDFMLKANGYQPIELDQIMAAAKAGRPVVNPSDQIVFNQTFNHGRIDNDYHYDNLKVLENTNPYERPVEYSVDNPVKDVLPAPIKDVANPNDTPMYRREKLSEDDQKKVFTEFQARHLTDLTTRQYDRATLDDQRGIHRVENANQTISLANRAKYQHQLAEQGRLQGMNKNDQAIAALQAQNRANQRILDSTQPHAVQGYVNNINVRPQTDANGQVITENGQVKLGIFMDAYDADQKQNVGTNPDINRPQHDHEIQISRQDLSHILQQNELPPLSNHDIRRAYQIHQPIVNKNDGLRFGFEFKPQDVGADGYQIAADDIDVTPNKLTQNDLEQQLQDYQAPLTPLEHEEQVDQAQYHQLEGYINQAHVVKEDGEYKIAVDAQRRRDVDPYSKFAGDHFFNAATKDNSFTHDQKMSMKDFNKILKANGRPQFKAQDLVDSYNRHEDLVNKFDNVAFCAGVKTVGRDSTLGQHQYQINPNQIVGRPDFQYTKDEQALEAQSETSRQLLDTMQQHDPLKARAVKHDDRYGFGQYQPLKMQDIAINPGDNRDLTRWQKIKQRSVDGLNRFGLAVGDTVDATQSYLKHAGPVVDRLKGASQNVKARFKEVPDKARELTKACHSWFDKQIAPVKTKSNDKQTDVQNAAQAVVKERGNMVMPTPLNRKDKLAQDLDGVNLDGKIDELHGHERSLDDKLKTVNNDKNVQHDGNGDPEIEPYDEGHPYQYQPKNAAEAVALENRDQTIDKLGQIAQKGQNRYFDKCRKELFVKSIQTGVGKDANTGLDKRYYFAELVQRGDVKNQETAAGKNVTTASIPGNKGQNVTAKLQPMTPEQIDKIYQLNHKQNPLKDDSTKALVNHAQATNPRQMVEISNQHDNLAVNAPVVEDLDANGQHRYGVNGQPATRVAADAFKAPALSKDQTKFNYDRHEAPAELQAQNVAKNLAAGKTNKLANDVHSLDK